MADLTREDILKLARLARLTVTEEEIEKYRAELNEILKYVEQLQSVDVSGLKPTTQVTGLTNVMREDEIIDYSVNNEDLLRLAPKSQDGQIKVKRMLA